MATIHDRKERARGCGFRKPGGIYLVAPELGHPCGKLPLALTRCPCCDAGIKPSRGWTWIDSGPLFSRQVCTFRCGEDHPTAAALGVLLRGGCALGQPDAVGRAGLLWVGEQFYPSPRAFCAEADDMGISRRISKVPRGFELGKTWVMLAHRLTIPVQEDGEPGFLPGIFRAFLPQRIEYVVKGTETELELERLEKRGFTLVRVTPLVTNQTELFKDETAGCQN